MAGYGDWTPRTRHESWYLGYKINFPYTPNEILGYEDPSCLLEHYRKITKHGSEHLRWILVQAAKAAGRTNNTTFRKFFNRIAYRKGANTATVALARKILCILWHLLMNKELYVDPIKNQKSTKKPVVQKKFSKKSRADVQRAIDFIVECGLEVIYPDSTLDQKLQGVNR